MRGQAWCPSGLQPGPLKKRKARRAEVEMEAEGHGDIVVKLVTIDVLSREGIKVFRKKEFRAPRALKF